MSGRGPADFSLRITAVDEGMKPREMWPLKGMDNYSLNQILGLTNYIQRKADQGTSFVN